MDFITTSLENAATRYWKTVKTALGQVYIYRWSLIMFRKEYLFHFIFDHFLNYNNKSNKHLLQYTFVTLNNNEKRD